MSHVSQLYPNFAQRLECAELAPAFRVEHIIGGIRHTRCESAGKPDALQTLRDFAAIADE